jgi:hypothetical protein
LNQRAFVALLDRRPQTDRLRDVLRRDGAETTEAAAIEHDVAFDRGRADSLHFIQFEAAWRCRFGID